MSGPPAYSSTPAYPTAGSVTPSYMYPAASAHAEPAVAPVVEATAPAAVPASATASGSKYTVKKGDTLYHIAKDKYGDGKQWQRIASANPGVSPTSLKVGQVLVMP